MSLKPDLGRLITYLTKAQLCYIDVSYDETTKAGDDEVEERV